MPKKKKTMSQTEQSAKFREAVRALIDAGELNPTEAEKKLEKLVASQKKPPPKSA